MGGKTAMKRPSSAAGRGAAPRASAPPAKRAKADPLLKDLSQLVKGLAMDAELPFDTREMLEGMMPAAFGPFKEDRHKFETSVVEMVGGVLSGVERGLQAEVQEGEEKVAGLGGERAGRESALQGAESRLRLEESDMAEKKIALAEAAKVFQAAKQALAAAKEEQTEGDKELVAAEGRMDKLRTCLAEQIEPLAAGSVTQEDVKTVINGLVQVLKTFGYDQSLLMSIPSSISKAPAARGDFDNTVVEQVQRETSRRLEELQRLQNEGGPAKEVRAAKVEEAEKAMSAASGKQSAAADTFSQAQAAAAAAATEHKHREDELKRLEPEGEKLRRRLEAGTKKLASFRAGPLDAFHRLSDRTAEAPPAPAAETAPAAEEAAA